jgi:hypothetical protein
MTFWSGGEEEINVIQKEEEFFLTEERDHLAEELSERFMLAR